MGVKDISTTTLSLSCVAVLLLLLNITTKISGNYLYDTTGVDYYGSSIIQPAPISAALPRVTYDAASVLPSLRQRAIVAESADCGCGSRHMTKEESIYGIDQSPPKPAPRQRSVPVEDPNLEPKLEPIIPPVFPLVQKQLADDSMSPPTKIIKPRSVGSVKRCLSALLNPLGAENSDAESEEFETAELERNAESDPVRIGLSFQMAGEAVGAPDKKISFEIKKKHPLKKLKKAKAKFVEKLIDAKEDIVEAKKEFIEEKLDAIHHSAENEIDEGSLHSYGHGRREDSSEEVVLPVAEEEYEVPPKSSVEDHDHDQEHDAEGNSASGESLLEKKAELLDTIKEDVIEKKEEVKEELLEKVEDLKQPVEISLQDFLAALYGRPCAAAVPNYYYRQPHVYPTPMYTVPSIFTQQQQIASLQNEAALQEQLVQQYLLASVAYAKKLSQNVVYDGNYQPHVQVIDEPLQVQQSYSYALPAEFPVYY